MVTFLYLVSLTGHKMSTFPPNFADSTCLFPPSFPHSHLSTFHMPHFHLSTCPRLQPSTFHMSTFAGFNSPNRPNLPQFHIPTFAAPIFPLERGGGWTCGKLRSANVEMWKFGMRKVEGSKCGNVGMWNLAMWKVKDANVE